MEFWQTLGPPGVCIWLEAGNSLCQAGVMDFVLSNAKLGFPGGSVVKNPPATTEDEGDMGSIPGTGRCPGRGNDSSSQSSCLENAHGQRSLAGCRPWAEEPGGLQAMGSQRAGHDWARTARCQTSVHASFLPLCCTVGRSRAFTPRFLGFCL